MESLPSEKPFTIPVKSIIRNYKTTKKGLSSLEAKKRLEQFGLNEITEDDKIHPVKIFIAQFKNFMVNLLLIAALVSFVLGERLDAIAILVIVILNAILGFIQEYQAEKAIKALKKLTAPHAIVIRNGVETEIPSNEIVPGDVVVLETGNIVPADIRLIDNTSLMVDESILTGESVPVAKHVRTISNKNAPVSERKNMVFSGTIITHGRGLGVAVYTGEKTEVGNISKLIKKAETKETILQVKLKELGKALAGITVLILIIISAIGIYIGDDPVEIFILGISLAVSAIPEGMPAIVTLTLAIGVQKMTSKNAIVRRLPSVETLGSVNIICTDKTGTLTKNQMSVEKIWVNGKTVNITGAGYKPEGNFILEGKKIEPNNFDTVMRALKIGALCNNAKLVKEENRWKIIGDPTEGALIVSAEKAGLTRENIEKFERVGEIPFDSVRKMMTTVNQEGKKLYAYVKGAPDILLDSCKYIEIDGKKQKLTKRLRDEILEVNEKMASEAYRMLGMAYRPVKKGEAMKSENIERDLIFVALQAMIDPPREEVKNSIKLCKTAGIRVIMITGDQKTTAVSIAKKVGIHTEQVIEGKELEDMTVEQLENVIEKVNVFARTNPKHKVKILQALKKKGYIVAMTGDGVNDAPAIKNSDVGIAMNLQGTDVAKEASDIILIDDNFATIVSAVEEGRHIFSNIKKFITFLLASNFSEIIVVLAAFSFGFPIPYIPIQLLWINLVTDGFPALALGVENVDKEIMKRPPRDPKENFLRKMMKFAIITGIMVSITTFIGFKYGLNYSTEKARTMAFTISVVFELIFAFSVRVGDKPMIKQNPFSNMYLVSAVLLSFILQLAAIYLGIFQKIFETVSLNAMDWIYIMAMCLIPIITLEFLKAFNLLKTDM